MNVRNWSNLVPWIKPPSNGNLWPDSPGYGVTLPSTTGALWAWQSHQTDDVPPAAFQSFASAMKCFMWAHVTGAEPGGGRQTVLTKEQELSCWELCLSSPIRKIGTTISPSHRTLPELRKDSKALSIWLLCKRCITTAWLSPRGLSKRRAHLDSRYLHFCYQGHSSQFNLSSTLGHCVSIVLISVECLHYVPECWIYWFLQGRLPLSYRDSSHLSNRAYHLFTPGLCSTFLFFFVTLSQGYVFIALKRK